jgi:hypothetical protein
VVENNLAWKVGNGELVRVGTDSVLGCGENVILSEDLIVSLQDRGICTLNHVRDQNTTTIWEQGWMTAQELSLDGEQTIAWNPYIAVLKGGHVRLKEEADSVAWAKNKSLGLYTSSLGYKSMFDSEQHEPIW